MTHTALIAHKNIVGGEPLRSGLQRLYFVKIGLKLVCFLAFPALKRSHCARRDTYYRVAGLLSGGWNLGLPDSRYCHLYLKESLDLRSWGFKKFVDACVFKRHLKQHVVASDRICQFRFLRIVGYFQADP